MSELKMDSGALEEAAENCESIDENEIIDVDSMDLEDSDRWLCDYNQCSSESRVHDLYAWLKSDPSEPQAHANALKKSIDTRTFTRVKRRSNKMNFDAIMESLATPPPHLIEKPKVPGQFRMEEATPQRTLEIPSMLRPKNSFITNSQSSSMNQESLEIFLNLSQSNSEFSEIMNESQPSLLYSSIISNNADETLKRNESLCDMDSGILSESMMQASIFQESLNINSFTEKNYESDDNNITRTFQHNNTFLANPINETKHCLSPVIEMKNNCQSPNLDETKICTSPFNQTLTCVNSLDMEKISPKFNETKEICEISFNRTKESISPIILKKFDNSPMERTYVNEANSPSAMSFSEKASSTHDEYSPIFMSKHVFDTSTPDDGKLSLFEKFDNLNATKINENSMENALIDADMTFNVKRLSCHKFLENSNNSHLNQNRNINNNNNSSSSSNSSKIVSASSLRQELLEEVERSCKNSATNHEKDLKREFNMTYENSMETMSMAAPFDYYKTYKKESLKKLSDIRETIPNDMIGRFQTFRKKNIDKNETFRKSEDNVNATFSKNDDGTNFDCTYSSNEMLANATFSKNEQIPEQIVNSTFCKPLKKTEIPNEEEQQNSTFVKPKIRKLPAPKSFSKLPQFLQKSNPNIPTSNALRTIKPPSSFAYPKGSQPNIPRNLGLYALGKYKSETDQRLVGVMRGSTEQIGNAGGSTESIESTQSAPDLDDRLSVCSDSSRSSYTISTNTRTIVRQSNITNSRLMQKLIPHGHKPESTPKPNRQILENTWMQSEKDLPSPILKNNIEGLQSGLLSPNDIKSSSPLLSPSSSSENINSLDIVKNNVREIKPSKSNEKLTLKPPNISSNRAKSPVDTKPKLRPPTNYNATRPTSIASGIPRPTSRIPAPKFTRPLSRIPDPKKG
ncbi:putative uncharacterized protein DDB_G0277255 [Leptopilina boulardi]|uniref:putative uncharacterized protein DDB_G0277255 n=1 Tax=Leptopilina boulardi TaxID=63433 RepID=UPI0021F64188|nr:putative uncharacterized protein DDB_G0277255 [Leptopilina boulardi]